MKSIETIGIAGFGPMGQLMKQHMLPNAKILISDPGLPKSKDNVLAINLSACDAVLLTVPAQNLQGVLKDVIVPPKVKSSWDEIDPSIKAGWVDPLIIDACSVKMFPEKVVETIDPDFPQLLHCHPLFGPQSTKDGLEGKTVIVTKKQGEKAEAILDFWQNERGLDIVEMTAEEHDREMAKIQAVTFVLGRLANQAGLGQLKDSALATFSSSIAGELALLDAAHSEALLETIVAFNPFVKTEILKLEQSLWQLESLCMKGGMALAGVGLLL
ncbi:prephenate dehydrogenase [Candidatus Saccharibacteria bacterium]|jgi:prephenate dehydrogenase|nr:MAG: prephenate dehydrogenase [Candidatus Saccharibacteria bacterium]